MRIAEAMVKNIGIVSYNMTKPVRPKLTRQGDERGAAEMMEGKANEIDDT